MRTEKKKEIPDVREVLKVRDSLRLALATIDLRYKRTGELMTVGELARMGLKIIFEGELAMVKEREKRQVFEVDIREVS